MLKKFSILLLLFLLVVNCKDQKNTQKQLISTELTSLQGYIFGTSYSIKYNSTIDYQKSVDSLYHILNKSLSTYQVNSDISKVNRNEDVELDKHFIEVFKASKDIFKTTKGAFDPTIGAVVNAWDFGPEGSIVELDSLKMDSLMTDVGFDKVSLEGDRIKKPKNTYLDFNAIAKGYAVDVISEFMENRGIENYLIEIGGEIRAKGKNSEKDSNWAVGIEEPNFDGQQSVLKAIELKDESMATSGVYRKFKVDDDGKRYSHIIDTKTGYPSKTNILGVSVIARTCMFADAYATAFKSMGIDKIKLFLDSNPEIKAFIIFENEDGEFETLSLNHFP